MHNTVILSNKLWKKATECILKFFQSHPIALFAIPRFWNPTLWTLSTLF
jgi:hypothetical protein